MGLERNFLACRTLSAGMVVRLAQPSQERKAANAIDRVHTGDTFEKKLHVSRWMYCPYDCECEEKDMADDRALHPGYDDHQCRVCNFSH
jgi:hypothetical protein